MKVGTASINTQRFQPICYNISASIQIEIL